MHYYCCCSLLLRGMNRIICTSFVNTDSSILNLHSLCSHHMQEHRLNILVVSYIIPGNKCVEKKMYECAHVSHVRIWRIWRALVFVCFIQIQGWLWLKKTMTEKTEYSSGPDVMPFILCQIDFMPVLSREHILFVFYADFPLSSHKRQKFRIYAGSA